MAEATAAVVVAAVAAAAMATVAEVMAMVVVVSVVLVVVYRGACGAHVLCGSAVDGVGAGLKSASFPAASVIPAPEMVAGSTVIPSTS